MKLEFSLILSIFLVFLLVVSAQNTKDWKYTQIDGTKGKLENWNQPKGHQYLGMTAGDLYSNNNLDILSRHYIYHNPASPMGNQWDYAVPNEELAHGINLHWIGEKIEKALQSDSTVEISKDNYMNSPHFLVRTPSITYYYDIAGGGFSRILDSYGNDWVSFKKDPWDQFPASAASSYRGLPNLIYKTDPNNTGAGHPGHDKCKSQVVGENKIRTVTKSGEWEWEWTFHNDQATLEIIKTNGNSPYWFLYEGTPGGNFSPEDYSYGTDVSGLNSDLPDMYIGSTKFGNFQWAYFNKKGVHDTFYVAQLNKDNKLDMMSYLGNTEKGVKSEDGMTVFGFGRGKGSDALMTGLNKFVIGFYPHAIRTLDDYKKLSKHLSKTIKKADLNK